MALFSSLMLLCIMAGGARRAEAASRAPVLKLRAMSVVPPPLAAGRWWHGRRAAKLAHLRPSASLPPPAPSTRYSPFLSLVCSNNHRWLLHPSPPAGAAADRRNLMHIPPATNQPWPAPGLLRRFAPSDGALLGGRKSGRLHKPSCHGCVPAGPARVRCHTGSQPLCRRPPPSAGTTADTASGDEHGELLRSPTQCSRLGREPRRSAALCLLSLDHGVVAAAPSSVCCPSGLQPNCCSGSAAPPLPAHRPPAAGVQAQVSATKCMAVCCRCLVWSITASVPRSRLSSPGDCCPPWPAPLLQAWPPSQSHSHGVHHTESHSCGGARVATSWRLWHRCASSAQWQHSRAESHHGLPLHVVQKRRAKPTHPPTGVCFGTHTAAPQASRSR